MKRIVIVSIMILAVSIAAFAAGSQEVNENGVVELERGTLARNSYLDDLDKVEISGVIKFESPVPELTSGGKDYTIFAPGMQMFSGYLTEGQRISVTGYILEEDSMFGAGRGRMVQDTKALDGNSTLMVETVEIDGTVYQLPWVDGFGPDNRGMIGRNGSGSARQGRGAGSRGMGSRGQGGFGGYMSDDCPYYN